MYCKDLWKHLRPENIDCVKTVWSWLRAFFVFFKNRIESGQNTRGLPTKNVSGLCLWNVTSFVAKHENTRKTKPSNYTICSICICVLHFFVPGKLKTPTLRILGMSWGVKLPPVFKALKRGVMNGGSGVSIGGVRILREHQKYLIGDLERIKFLSRSRVSGNPTILTDQDPAVQLVGWAPVIFVWKDFISHSIHVWYISLHLP